MSSDLNLPQLHDALDPLLPGQRAFAMSFLLGWVACYVPAGVWDEGVAVAVERAQEVVQS